MAELILTEEEKAMPFADLPDDVVGKITKKPMFTFEKDPVTKDSTPWHIKIAIIAWAAKAVEVNADHAEATIFGASVSGKNLGDWKLTLDRLDSPEEPDEPEDQDERIPYRSIEIRADEITPGARLSTAVALIRSGLTALFLGKMDITITKHMKITNMSQGVK